MTYHLLQILVFTMALLTALPVAASVETFKAQQNLPSTQVGTSIPSSLSLCYKQQKSFDLCNRQASATFVQNQSKTHVEAKLPAPYSPETYTLSCLSVNGQFGFDVTPKDLKCIADKQVPCAEKNETICGISVPVAGGNSVGEISSIPIPVMLDKHGNRLKEQILLERCVLDENDRPEYRPENVSSIQCGTEICSPGYYNICGHNLYIDKEIKIGEFTMATAHIAERPIDVSFHCTRVEKHHPIMYIPVNPDALCSIDKMP